MKRLVLLAAICAILAPARAASPKTHLQFYPFAAHTQEDTQSPGFGGGIGLSKEVGESFLVGISGEYAMQGGKKGADDLSRGSLKLTTLWSIGDGTVVPQIGAHVGGQRWAVGDEDGIQGEAGGDLRLLFPLEYDFGIYAFAAPSYLFGDEDAYYGTYGIGLDLSF